MKDKDAEQKTRTPVSVTTVEERKFKDREGSLVVCHRIISMKRDEGRKEEEERIRSTYHKWRVSVPNISI